MTRTPFFCKDYIITNIARFFILVNNKYVELERVVKSILRGASLLGVASASVSLKTGSPLHFGRLVRVQESVVNSVKQYLLGVRINDELSFDIIVNDIYFPPPFVKFNGPNGFIALFTDKI